MDKKCVVCKKPFKVKPSLYEKKECCNRKCSDKKRFLDIIWRLENDFNEKIYNIMEKEYRVKRKSYRQLEKELHINNRTVKKILDYCGIEPFDSSEAIKNQWLDNDKRRKSAKKTLEKNLKELGKHPRTLKEEEIVKRLHGGDFVLVERLKSSVVIECAKCNKVKTVKLDVIKGDNFCDCQTISFGERTIEKFLKDRNIDYTKQFRIESCRNKKSLPFDFAIKNEQGELKMLIEYDGKQHFNPLNNFGKDRFQDIRKNDNIKNSYCLREGIPLLRISYKDDITEKLNAIF